MKFPLAETRERWTWNEDCHCWQRPGNPAFRVIGGRVLFAASAFPFSGVPQLRATFQVFSPDDLARLLPVWWSCDLRALVMHLRQIREGERVIPSNSGVRVWHGLDGRNDWGGVSPLLRKRAGGHAAGRGIKRLFFVETLDGFDFWEPGKAVPGR